MFNHVHVKYLLLPGCIAGYMDGLLRKGNVSSIQMFAVEYDPIMQCPAVQIHFKG